MFDWIGDIGGAFLLVVWWVVLGVAGVLVASPFLAIGLSKERGRQRAGEGVVVVGVFVAVITALFLYSVTPSISGAR